MSLEEAWSMSEGRLGSALLQVRSLFSRGSLSGVDEARLLERFVVHRDEEAFEVLLARHGPMVLGVCRRMLDDPRDVEDAFQATFLVLVRKAGTLRARDLLANWLYGVSHRVAVRVRANAYRRRQRERPVIEEVAVPGEPREDPRELRAVLDDELARLPARLRAAVVLCDLEGLPQEEAARRLGCAVGTIKSRLSRARARLRGRLLRRGVAPSALLAGWSLTPDQALAAVPAPLQMATLRAASRFAAGAAISAPTVALVEGVVRSLTMSNIKVMAAASLALAFATAGTLALVARAGPDGKQQADAAPPVPPRTPRQVASSPSRILELRVVRKSDQQPIPGASIESRLSGEAPFATSTTNAEGRCTIPIPIPPVFSHPVEVGAFVDGFVPASLLLKGGALDVARLQPATLELEPGILVGGLVKDREGRPVEGVRIFAQIFESQGHPRFFFEPSRGVATTDAQGRWRASILPADATGHLGIRLAHPGFFSAPLGYSQGISIEQARALTAVSVIVDGVRVAGTVVGPDEKAISGATVTLPLSGTRGDWLRTTSDSEGRFEFPHAEDRGKRGEVIVYAQAPGFAPAWARVEVPPTRTPVVLRLNPGRTLRGRVVDRNQRPLAGATVTLGTWEECRYLDGKAVTDVEGRFALPHAPSAGDPFLDVEKPGYSQAVHRKVARADPEPVVALNRPVHVRGTVVDAENGRPIDAFELLPGVVQEGRVGPVSAWDEGQAIKGTRGRFAFPLDIDQSQFLVLRVRAEGYRPDDSRPFGPGEVEMVVDYRLTRAEPLPPIAGIVRSLDGKRLPGVEVYLATQTRRLQLRNGRPEPGWESPRMKTITSPDGSFMFQAPGEQAFVIALDDRGFAVRNAAELSRSPDLTLEAWGRIEGTLLLENPIGAKRFVNLDVSRAISKENDSQFSGYENEVDDRGRFVIERVMPDEDVRVNLRVPWRLGRLSALATPLFSLKPGETVRVTLGGSGRPITGRVRPPDGSGADFDFGYVKGTLSLKLPPIPRPEGFDGWDANRQQEFLRAFWNSPEGRARHRLTRSYEFKAAPNGSFRAEGVIPGTYELTVQALAHLPPRPTTAQASGEVEVPEIPGGRDAAPIDVGTIRLVATPPAHEVPAPAPPPP